MSEHTNPYGVSFIQTAAGAVITGEIVRFNTYQEMCESTSISATRLASVANASHDEDYDVPPDHIGGVLYQRDTISNTWVLLYSEKDLAVPTYVNWNHILDIPKWVGGITHNRVKLTENRFAELRTTYYSFGSYNLIMPRPDETKVVRGETVYAFDLGEEVVLEQYANDSDDPENPSVGAILIPYVEGDILTETAEVRSVNGNWYQVIFTYAPSSYRLEGEDTIRVTKHAYSFRLICTEDDNGKRYWTLCTTNDEAVNAITELRREHTNHILAENPHNQYVRKIDLRHYLLPATTRRSGSVVLAVRSDVENNNTTKAVTPYLLKDYVDGVITYHCDALDRKIQTHISDSELHVSPSDRLRWDNAASGSGSGDVEAHNIDPDAHRVLFSAIETQLRNKQDKLVDGAWIELNDTNSTINCTLKAGPGITITSNGEICCDAGMISDASTTQKGIVRLVDVITDPDDITTALTPRSIKDIRDILFSLYHANPPVITCTKTATEQSDLADGHHVFRASREDGSSDANVSITTKILFPRIALSNADYQGVYTASNVYLAMWTETGTKAQWSKRREIRNLRVYYNVTESATYVSMDVYSYNNDTITHIDTALPTDGTKYKIYSETQAGRSHDTTTISFHIWMDSNYVIIQGYVSAYGEEKDYARVIVKYDPNITWTWTKNEQ